MAAVGKMNEFWRVLKDLNPETVRRNVEQGFTLAVLGSYSPGKSLVCRAFSPDEGCSASEYLTEVQTVDGANRHLLPPKADLFLYVADAHTGLSGADVSELEQLYLLARPTALVFVGEGCGPDSETVCNVRDDLGGLVTAVATVDPSDPVAAERELTNLLLRTVPSKSLAMANRLPMVRAQAADMLIAETSRVNAEFALLSNLPANIPVVGTLMGAGADFLILTKNQAMLVLKLAAVYGHSLDSRWRLAAEMAPVVGAALAWRTVSRLLIGALPSFIAALPKAMIAYAGTYVVGKSAKYYFEHGQRPTPEQEREFAREGTARWQDTLAGVGR